MLEAGPGDALAATALRAIRKHPGLSMHALIRQLQVPRRAVEQAVEALVAMSLVSKSKPRELYPFGMPRATRLRAKAFQDPKLKILLDAIAANPETMRQVDIVEHAELAWNWPRSTTKLRLQRLRAAGMVRLEDGVFRVVEVPSSSP